MSQHHRQTSTSSLPHRTPHNSSTASAAASNATTTAVAGTTGATSPAKSPRVANPTPSQPSSQLHPRSTPANTTAAREPSATRLRDLTTHEVVRRIISPGSVLFQHQPPPPVTRQRLQEPTPQPANMDRRHPSSFQQLEKLGEGTYATVRCTILIRKHTKTLSLPFGLDVPSSLHGLKPFTEIPRRVCCSSSLQQHVQVSSKNRS